MIAVENLKVKIHEKNILNNVSMHFQKGKFNTIIGPNGCGKSTLVKALAGIIIPNNGTIIIDEKLKNKLSKREFAQKVAFVMQQNEEMNYFTVNELVAYGRQPYKNMWDKTNEEDQDAIDWAIEVTGLSKLKDNEVHNLSGGERQRAYLALALAQKTEIIVLDEPTNHLDIKYQYEILKLLQKINKEEGITIICVLHDLNHAIRFSDYLFVMQRGSVYSHGIADKALNAEVIKNLYNIKCQLCTSANYKYIEVL